jgi:hypothetical protein
MDSGVNLTWKEAFSPNRLVLGTTPSLELGHAVPNQLDRVAGVKFLGNGELKKEIPA